MNISVLGSGRWASFLAWYADRIGHSVMLRGREDSEGFRRLSLYRQNEYLQLGKNIRLTASVREAVVFSDYILISINAQNLRELTGELSSLPVSCKTFILCMKGLEAASGKRLSEVISGEIGNAAGIAVWVGPGHVQDFIKGIPNCMVISSQDKNLTKILVEMFAGDIIRFYYGDDLIGTEIGAASKNVIGIAAGMLDGLKASSLKGALMARGASEISRLIRTMGGDERTAYGLSHLGDYEATLFSPFSHNREFGEKYVLGQQFGKLAEGADTVQALHRLSVMHRVELPICNTVYDILVEKKNPYDALIELFMRPLKKEFW
ncbi:MAG: glycerol-3-phosphate dehydrogenase [Bacteroidetes bacterium]|nr:glycerol-3-phosphate dehydrogenase [Bacteroidota bacterium]